jgi:hypothetical protein
MSNLLDNIFINLRVIGKIPPKGRICTTSPGQVKLDQEGYTSKIWRTVTRDSRDKSIKLLTSLANDVTEISDNIISSLYFSRNYEGDRMSMFQINENTKKCHQLKKLVRELNNCKPGLKNLMNTYNKDILMNARIEEIEDKFNIQIEKIQKALDRIGTSSDNPRPRQKNNNNISTQSITPTYTSNIQSGQIDSEESNDDDEESQSIDLFDT